MIVNNDTGFRAKIIVITDQNCSSVIATKNGITVQLQWSGNAWTGFVANPGVWEVIATKDSESKSVEVAVTEAGTDYSAQIAWIYTLTVTSDFPQSWYSEVKITINGTAYDVAWRTTPGTYQTTDPVIISRESPSGGGYNPLHIVYNGEAVTTLTRGQSYTFNPVKDTTIAFVTNGGSPTWYCYITD